MGVEWKRGGECPQVHIDCQRIQSRQSNFSLPRVGRAWPTIGKGFTARDGREEREKIMDRVTIAPIFCGYLFSAYEDPGLVGRLLVAAVESFFSLLRPSKRLGGENPDLRRTLGRDSYQ